MVHLHLHSMYSLRDSIIKPEDLVDRLKDIGQSAVAITDHGGSLGGVSIYKLLKKNGIKYIHGCEFYICDDVSVKDKNNKYYHLIALCKNDVGRKNLNRLISESERPEHKYVKPRIDFELLSRHKDGLIIMSACMAGEVSKYLLCNKYERAKEIALLYKELMGNDYYLEIQSHRDGAQIELNKKILALSKDTNIPCVVTCDAHHTLEEDRKYQIKYAFNGSYKEDGESYIDCFVQSEKEVRNRLSYLDTTDVDRAIALTDEIADQCNVEMPLSAPIMPKIETPKEYCNNKEWLHSLCCAGARKKLNIDLETSTIEDKKGVLHSIEDISEYVERYHYEMNALEKMGFVDYILLVYSYSNIGKRRGIARGSGGGSLINYLTNITNIDPIEHGLYFERFIDVSALDRLDAGEITAKELKVPDIDLDFSGESCKQVLQFLHDTYGENMVASIGKFGNNYTKGTIRDMCKVLDIDLATADEIAKSFENYELSEIDKMISGDIDTTNGAANAINMVRKYPVLFEYVRKLCGLPKSFGLHACGKIISTRELDDFLPSCFDKDGIRFLQGDMHDVEDVGLVKIDLLGLRTLDQEYDTLEMSGENESFIDPRQSYSDEKVLDVFRKGDTVGIFQMASFGMRQTLKKMNVSGINDISVANALFRPGAMQYIDNYCRRKAGEEEFEYLHKDLEPILRDTYGIIVFQEQLIEIGRMAGIRNPDLLRKATGKKDPALLASVKPELETCLKNRGWTEQQFEKLWSDMLDFARYSFNKCVSGSTRILRASSRKDRWHPTVEEMYYVRNNIEYAKKNNKMPLRYKYIERGYGSALSMFEDGRIHKNIIKNITYQGDRNCLKIVTESGASIECTENHKIPTKSGYKFANDIVIGDILFAIGSYQKSNFNRSLTKGDFIPNYPPKGTCGFTKNPNGASVIFNGKRKKMANMRCPCEQCGRKYSEKLRFELHHKDKDRTNNDEENLLWVCNSCHKKLEYKAGRTKAFEKGIPVIEDPVVEISDIGVQRVYDVEMCEPAHNFVTDSGLVVCNSHSSAYAIIAYMTAKQKAYYPAEFFAGLCNSFIGDSAFVKDHVQEIVSDIEKHRIRIAPFNFRRDHRTCNVENGEILWAIPLIKDCNVAMANILFSHRNTSEKYFWRLATKLKESGVGIAQIRILVMLDFFVEFGSSRRLMRILEFAERFNYGSLTKIAKSKVESSTGLFNICMKYGTDIGKTGNELKSIQILNCPAILDAVEELICSVKDVDIDLKSKIAYQQERLGFSNMVTGREADRPKLFVTAVYNATRKSDGFQFGYNITAKSIGSGKTTTYTVLLKEYEKDPIKKGDLILCRSFKKNRGGYFELVSYEHIFL